MLRYLKIIILLTTVMCLPAMAAEPRLPTISEEQEKELEQALRNPDFQRFLRQVDRAGPLLVEPPKIVLPENRVPVDASPIDPIDRQIQTTIENLRNRDLPGYKQRKCDFAVNRKTGTVQSGIKIDLRPGPPVDSGRELDLAIEGDGFFRVIDPNDGSILYTRCGTFECDGDGNLALIAGHIARTVQPPIRIPEEGVVEITPNGKVFALASNGDKQELGQLTIARFRNPDRLVPVDDRCFQVGEFSGPAIDSSPGRPGFGTIRQRTLERSNVEPERALQELERLLQLKKSRSD